MERVIGYRKILKDVIAERPIKWTGEGDGFKDLSPCTQKRIVYRPIYEQCGPTTFNMMDSPVLPIRETPLWGINTDNATGKKRK